MKKLNRFLKSRAEKRGAKCALRQLMALSMLTSVLLIPLPLTTSLASAAETPYSEAFKAYDEKHYDKAFALLLPLAEQGQGQAQLAVSLLYERGLGVDQDIDKAMYWYEKAALRGDPVIQNELGLKYFNGDGVARDYDKAATWWLKAAARDHVEAQYGLALMYVNGTGFTKNMVMAMKWLDKAAVRDYGPAHYSLGVIFATGTGAPRDYTRAFEHFSKAASQGIVEAQYNLGVCHEKGRGTAVDPEQANAWYQKAAAQGFAKAQAKLDPKDIATAAPIADVATTPTAAPETVSGTGAQTVLKPALEPSTATHDITIDATTPHQEDWLAQQNPDAYALQLVVVSSLASVTRFFDTYQITPPKAYYTINRDEKVLYRIVCGVFDSLAAAQAASADMGEQLSGLNPVIVRYAAIQAALND